MGNYDFLLKFLGHENKFEPNNLNLELDGIENASTGMTVTEEEISPQNWDNLDSLINAATSGKDEKKAPPAPAASPAASLDELSDMPFGREDTSEPAPMDDLSEYSALAMTDDGQTIDEDFAAFGEDPFPAPPAEKKESADVFSEEAWGAPETKAPASPTPAPAPSTTSPAAPETKPGQAAVGITAEVAVDPDVLEEMNNLDMVPPSLDELHRRFQEGGGPQDLIQDIMDETAAEQDGESPYDMDNVEIEGEGAQGGYDFSDIGGLESTGAPNEIESEFSDLLAQAKMGDEEKGSGRPAIDIGEPPLEPEAPAKSAEPGKDLSGEEAGLGDLEALFDDSHPSFPEDASMTPGMPDESFMPDAGGTEFPGESFEMPDFGAEDSAELKTSEPDLSAFMETDNSPQDDLSALMEPGAPQEDLSALMEPGAPQDDLSALMESETAAEMPEFPVFDEPEAGAETPGFASFDEPAGMEFPEPSFEADGIEEVQELPDDEEEASLSEPAFGAPSSSKPPVGYGRESDIDLDESKLLKIRNRINVFADPDLRKKLRKIFIDRLLPKNIMEQLVAMLILEQPEDAINRFIKENVPEEQMQVEEEIEERPEVPKPKTRRVIFTEEARKAEEFQKELQNITKYAAIFFGLLLVVAILIWRLVWVPGNASRSYEDGIAELKKGNYVVAEAKFTEGENKGGPDMDWYNRYAIAYLEKNEFQLAEKKFLQALQEKPLDKLTVFNFAEYYKSVYPKKYDKAVAILSSLKKKMPDEFDVVDRLGQTYIEWGDNSSTAAEQSKYYDEAKKTYQEFLSKNAKHIGTMFRQIEIAIREKDDELITYLLQRIAVADPKAINVEVMTRLARYYNDNRNMKEAKTVLLPLIDFIDQNMPKKGQPVEKEEKNKKNFKSNEIPKKMLFSEAYYEYARYLTLNMNYIDALIAASNSIILNAKNGKAYNLRGEIYYISEGLTGNIELAKNEFESATNFAPYYYKPYANLGHIYYYNRLQMSDPEKSLSKALMAYKTARYYLPEGQKDFLLQYNLAWLYYREKSYEKASEEWQDLYIDEPYNPILSFALGNTYYHTGKYSLAKTQYEKAIEYYDSIAQKMGYINPELQRHIEIYSQLAHAYNNKGVVNLIYAYQYAAYKDKYEQDALLDFYQAKNSANKIKVIYAQAEANIKYILNPAMKNQQPAFDDEIPMRTTLQDIIDEFKANLLKGI
ncbi:MAG: tetratricopeptide repeat protein [Brevinematales bacterium]|nr:tetratricopeptide repeat protein [Brevinematales bacterium]